MNGTQLDKELDIVKQFKDLQYKDTLAFCQFAFNNKIFALGWAAEFGHLNSYLNMADVLANKIKNNEYDDEAVQIARIFVDKDEHVFLKQLFSRKESFEKSVSRQIAKYRWAARALKSTQQLLQLAVIIGAASVPLVLSNPASPREISTYISIVVAASAALLKFYRFQDNINFHHTAAEKMQLEYSQYSTQRGEYERLGIGAALDLFMDNIDKLRQETNELSLTLEKKAQDRLDDQFLRVDKSLSEMHQRKDAQ